MDCNRDEAIRARAMAEEKMKAGDFPTARKIVLKARQLFPELENVAQLLTVCDVHCSSQIKIHGTELDLYEILQVEKFSEEAVIKKQFRKMALYLHPDKNKFPGAEAAFKLISEAQNILTDQGRRLVYDMKCKGQMKPPVQKQPAKPKENATQQRAKKTTFQPQGAPTGAYPIPPKQQWQKILVSCPFCKIQYQAFLQNINERVYCHTCRRYFYANNIDRAPPMWNPFSNSRGPNHGNSYPSFVPFQGGIFNQNFVPKADPFTDANAKGEAPMQGKSSAGTTSNEGNGFNLNNRFNPPSMPKADEPKEKNAADDKPKEATNDENVDFVAKESGESSENVGRKSDRKRNKVSYNEADYDFLSPSKKKKSFTSASVEEINVEEAKHKDEEESKKNKKKQASDSASEPKEDKLEETVQEESKEQDKAPLVSADPQFSDFDALRDKKMFEADQVWACYDPLDGMPRFYARISKVHTSRFKLTINWLECRPTLPEETTWFQSELPISCGRFGIGEKQIVKERDMFSHQVNITKTDECFTVVPRKGETWAVFKDWSIKWLLAPESHQPPYELHYVEILSDFDEKSGVQVTLLTKVEGYNSVYRRATSNEASPFVIPKDEMLRFSHPVLSQRININEANGSLEGCFELDSACLAEADIQTEDRTPPNEPEAKAASKKDKKSEPKAAAKKDEKPEFKAGANEYQTFTKPPNSCVENGKEPTLKTARAVVEVTHYDFNQNRSRESFTVGQIWALFSDIEKLPRQFACVKNIKFSPSFKIDVVMLKPLFPPKGSVCGKYELSKTDRRNLSPSSFSHLVKAESVNYAFEIFPKTGEVWAVHKTLVSNGVVSVDDLDYVEVLEGSEQPKVAVLEPMQGGADSFFRVAKGPKGDRVSDLSRFSHQCAAVRPCDVGGDKRLSGCWEIDRLSRTWYVIILD